MPLLTQSTDQFMKLPTETIHHICHLLGSGDTTFLCLSSRAFGQLPISLWHRLVLDKLPWIYEAWRSARRRTLFLGIALVASDLAKIQEEKSKFLAEGEQRRNIIREDMPESYDAWVRGVRGAEIPIAGAGN
jgi:hypothetical protein